MIGMLEAAEPDTDVRVGTVQPAHDPDGLDEVRRLLHSQGLGIDGDIECFVTAHVHGELVGCLGLAGSVVKCAACAPDSQGEGLAARLMERMNYEALDRGRGHLFAFTKPHNREIFECLGFTFLAEVPGSAVLLENTPFGFESYLAKLRAQRLPGTKIGGVVLNANPFTLGHRYLVESAAADVDALHVFVVSEDASLFSSETRLRLVREGVAELGLGDRVRVHAGSRYIVSRATFPNYFLKRAAERASAAAGLDLQLFRTGIAVALGITDRYVGSEPLSAVTAAYNAEMRHWLEVAPSPAPVVRVHELERRELGGGPISASRVRACIEARDLDAIARLVPRPTLDHITRRFFPDRLENPCASSEKH